MIEFKIYGGNQDRMGEKNPRWSGGSYRTSTRRAKEILGSLNIDLFTCSQCNKKGHLRLHIHHKDENRLNNQIENLEVLCFSCHRKKHSYSRRDSTNQDMRWCFGCTQFLPLSEFTKNKRTKDGLESRCKSCVNERKRLNYSIDKVNQLGERK